jgi:nicotinate-nucleotide--dimethylbenzimidazole phosphoribosyltransferase
MDYRQIVLGIKPADVQAREAARAYCDTLIKPLGSLGRLEDIAIKLAGITGEIHNHADRRAMVVMAADNGVYDEGVASAPQSFTKLQAVNMTRGICGVSVLSRLAGADLTVVDIGIREETECPEILDCNIRRGTANMAKGPAMTREEAEAAIAVGAEIAAELYEQSYEILGTGEMGIGNTTSTAAVLITLTGIPAERAVGRGAGLTDEALAGKIEVVKRALALNAPDPEDPIDVLAKVGGLDIAGLTGCFLAAAVLRKPILIDGAISAVAALIAARLAPDAKDFMIATHRSCEPAYDLIMKELGLEPVLEMEMRLGEGSGAALAFPIVSAACAMMNEMGTFADISFDETVLVDIRDTDMGTDTESKEEF